ncbi:MAG: hypothetical protein NZ578_14675 [Candidatus Binatia bacterium]|nr:hypothetical protein [Candidatus Binatia bacterium]
MVNSLQRLLSEIIVTLDRAGQQVHDPYVRSQVFAVIDILTNMAPRVEWQQAEVRKTIDDLRSVLHEIAQLLGENDPCPEPLVELCEQVRSVATVPVGDDVVAERDRLSRLFVTAMERVDAWRNHLPEMVVRAIEQRCDAYLRRQLDRDLALVRRPLFRRMSQA